MTAVEPTLAARALNDLLKVRCDQHLSEALELRRRIAGALRVLDSPDAAQRLDEVRALLNP